MLANLAGIVRPRTAGVPLHLDDGFPVGTPFKCETQIFLLRLAFSAFRVHVTDDKAELAKNLSGCYNQLITISRESPPNTRIGLLSFSGQFLLNL